MLQSLGLLLACQLAGEVLGRAAGLPVPGPVIGLVLLAGLLGLGAATGRVSAATIEATPLGRTAGGLLGVLGILFVPAGTGVIQQFGLLGQYGLALGLALLGSTVLAMLVTVYTFLLVGRWVARR